RRLFAEGAFSQSFVPVFAEAQARQSHAELQRLVDVVSGTLGGVLCLVTAGGVLGAPLLLGLFAPGFGSDPAKYLLGVHLLRITFPYLMLISLTALASGVLNSHGRFAIPAVTSSLLNLCMIAAVLIDARSVEVLAWAVLAGGFVQLGFQLPSLARLKLLPRPRWGWHDPQVRRILRLMLPILLGSSVAQISLLLDTVIASLLGTGPVSWLYYADRVMEFPLGLFSIALGTVILPHLASHHARRSEQAFSDTLDWGLRAVLVIGAPAAVGLLLLAGPLISTLFQHARFTTADVAMTRWALMAFALGFMGFSLVKILVPGFYARQETRAPVRYALVALAAGMAMSVVLVGVLWWFGWSAAYAGLAASTSINAWVNATLLLRRLKRDGIYRPRPGWMSFGARLVLANLAMAALLLWLGGDLASWTRTPTLLRVERLFEVIAAAVALYFAVLWLAGLRIGHLRHAPTERTL
ncbi:MAG: murein biosynthesis integral membrane protein MurJ, partial [Gammaproteobacteria bacterium]|nr:murein biosynthesis integral membrane protein MurJ [Gammaproteobacteria bacterium]